jgi:hypothetical protein
MLIRVWLASYAAAVGSFMILLLQRQKLCSDAIYNLRRALNVRREVADAVQEDRRSIGR